MTQHQKLQSLFESDSFVPFFNILRPVFNTFAGLLTALILFTTALNVSQPFAESVSSIPILNSLSPALIFVQSDASGQILTDGTDLSELGLEKDPFEDQFTFDLKNKSENLPLSQAYSLNYSENPALLTLNLKDAVLISPNNVLDSIRLSPYVTDAYYIFANDHTVSKLNIVFSGPVKYTQTATDAQSKLIIDITMGTEESMPLIYSIRSYSYAEALPSSFDALALESDRILRDDHDNYILELAQSSSRAEAENLLNTLKGQTDIPLLITARATRSVPSYIPLNKDTLTLSNSY